MTGLDLFILATGAVILLAAPHMLIKALGRRDRRRVWDIVFCGLALLALGLEQWQPSPVRHFVPLARWVLRAVVLLGGATVFGLSSLLFRPGRPGRDAGPSVPQEGVWPPPPNIPVA